MAVVLSQYSHISFILEVASDKMVKMLESITDWKITESLQTGKSNDLKIIICKAPWTIQVDEKHFSFNNIN